MAEQDSASLIAARRFAQRARVGPCCSAAVFLGPTAAAEVSELPAARGASATSEGADICERAAKTGAHTAARKRTNAAWFHRPHNTSQHLTARGTPTPPRMQGWRCV